MREQLQSRLEALRKEYETGQTRLRELEAEETYVRETLLRISGAIQVLQELTEQFNQRQGADSDAALGTENQ